MTSRSLQRRRDAFVASLIAGALTVTACSSPTSPGGQGPAISCPVLQTFQSPDGFSMLVTYGNATVTNGTLPVTVTCSPGNGSRFPVGDTTVTCTARDADRRVSSCSFVLTVTPAPELSVTRFAAFGDSITWGEDGTNSPSSISPFDTTIHPAVQLPTLQTYPGALQQLLVARYTKQSPTVANQGLRGEQVTDPNTRPRFSGLLGSGLYDVVLVMEGSNDLGARDAGIYPAVIATLRDMLREARGRGIRPYLATVPPMNPAGFRGTAWSQVPGFNDQIRALAGSEGVPLVDVYQTLNTDINRYIGFDGLHPTAAGYTTMADLFATAIKETLELPATPTSSATTGGRRTRTSSSATPAGTGQDSQFATPRAR